MDCTAWMPADMDPALKDEFAAAYPDDCHAAAAAAWEHQAATVADDTGGTAGVTAVSTGAQSITYRDDGYGSGARGDALRRASYHRSRTRVRSVQVGPSYEVHRPLNPHRLAGLRATDEEDGGVIPTVPVGTIGEGP